MSYILEALKKSDAERKRSTLPTFEDSTPILPPTTTASTGYMGWIVSGLLGVAVIGLSATLYLQPEAPSFSNPWDTFSSAPKKHVAASAPAPKRDEPPAPAPAPAPAPTSAPAPPPQAMPQVATPPAIADVRSEPVDEAPFIEPAAPAQSEATQEPPQEVIPQPEPALSSPVIEVIEPDEIQETAVQTAKPVEQAALPDTVSDLATEQISKDEDKPNLITVPEPKTGSEAEATQTELRVSRKIEMAWAAIDRGHYTQALRELNAAIGLQPNHADAWFARGWANEKAGNELSAIGDYARAINAKPDHAFALFSRGFLNLYVGNPSDAITDFVRTRGVTNDPALKLYAHLWGYLSRARSMPDLPPRLDDDVIRENTSRWPGHLIRHIQGNLSEGEVLAAIELGNTQQIKEQRCTGYFFLGVQALINKNPRKARRFFEQSLATGALEFRQYDAAKRELELMKLNN